jgi:hypothetical protein
VRICDAAVLVLRETNNPAVMTTDAGLLHAICERAGRPHRGFRTEKLIMAALSKQPGVLIPRRTKGYRNITMRIFYLPECVRDR